MTPRCVQIYRRTALAVSLNYSVLKFASGESFSRGDVLLPTCCPCCPCCERSRCDLFRQDRVKQGIALRPSSSQREPRVPAVGLGRLDSVIPGGFAGDDAGVEIKKDGLAGVIVGLLENGKIELPPVRERQVR